MTWNYRVMKHVDPKGNESLMIHEVCYDEQGSPKMYSENSTAPYGETLKELRSDLKYFAEALKKPVLTAADFPRTAHKHPSGDANDRP